MQTLILQELLDDSMDIKIEVVDDMLFAMLAFFSCWPENPGHPEQKTKGEEGLPISRVF